MSAESKVAIVTGGGRGMGAAIARELHGRGYALALMSPPGSAEQLAAERVHLGRLGTVQEIAETAAFLLSDGAGYITGQNIRLDGGVTRRV
jgi:NAD(P)-dependent dehydrogenase (short-subunit alcohol dehydrogenase family)